MTDIEELSEEQRISLLEGKVGKNRTFITIVALTLIVILSVSLTVLILKLLHADEPFVPISRFEEQKLVIQQLKTDIADQQKLLTALTLTYDRSQVAAFQNTLIEQEQSYQEFLAALRVGMFDLAKMVQGSRTWLDVYTETLEDAQRFSNQREKSLKRISTKTLQD
jgi:hypothetical protein